VIADMGKAKNKLRLAVLALAPPAGQGIRPISLDRSAFTLFELILAIVLSATLLTLIGAAINLYLTQVDASRGQVEEAQLARSILALIADDIRATFVYRTQDTSSIAQLMASTVPFDIDSIDAPTAAGVGNSADTSRLPSNNTSAPSSTATSTVGVARASTTATGSASGNISQQENGGMALGLNGSLNELYVDVARLPRREELFSTVTGYTNAPLPAQPGGMKVGTMNVMAVGTVPPSDLKSVHYFVRRGEQMEVGSTALNVLDEASQQRAAGLVRQEVPHMLRAFAEQVGNARILESGQALVAPELIHIEFRYFDGSQVVEQWDMRERNSLPIAVEVRIWLSTPDPDHPTLSYYDLAEKISNARQYRQTVYLPMSIVAGSVGSGATSGDGVPSSSSSTGSSFDSTAPAGNSGLDSMVQ